MKLEVLYRDDSIVAINKPHGLLVHRTKLAADAEEFALQLLRDQLGQKLFPVHRLDRKTAGVLLFALSSAAARSIQGQFESRTVEKEYLAIVRGYFPAALDLDYPLKNEKDVVQDAQTSFELISQTEIPLAHGKFESSRYSLVMARPKTGRMQQIRRHLKHLFHPIIGDRPHGCNKQNRLFLKEWQMGTCMLCAKQLSFDHPITSDRIVIEADLSLEFKRVLSFLNLSYENIAL